jgi:hypothetical protein
MRVGPKMQQILDLASRPGGIMRIDAAKRVGPHGSLGYGYQIVNRCIKAGLVRTGVPYGRRGLAIFVD